MLDTHFRSKAQEFLQSAVFQKRGAPLTLQTLSFLFQIKRYQIHGLDGIVKHADQLHHKTKHDWTILSRD